MQNSINDKWDEHRDRVRIQITYVKPSVKSNKLQGHQLSLSCGKQVSVNSGIYSLIYAKCLFLDGTDCEALNTFS